MFGSRSRKPAFVSACVASVYPCIMMSVCEENHGKQDEDDETKMMMMMIVDERMITMRLTKADVSARATVVHAEPVAIAPCYYFYDSYEFY